MDKSASLLTPHLFILQFELDCVATSEDPETAQSAVTEPVYVRLSHQQRVQLKETMGRVEAKLKISRTIWYTKWRQIYKDPNREKRELAQGKRETIKKLMKFS